MLPDMAAIMISVIFGGIIGAGYATLSHRVKVLNSKHAAQTTRYNNESKEVARLLAGLMRSIGQIADRIPASDTPENPDSGE